jgi:hypothetical protein
MLRLDVQLMRNFWRNWIRESGGWSVALEGAFLADRGNAHQGGSKSTLTVERPFCGTITARRRIR